MDFHWLFLTSWGWCCKLNTKLIQRKVSPINRNLPLMRCRLQHHQFTLRLLPHHRRYYSNRLFLVGDHLLWLILSLVLNIWVEFLLSIPLVIVLESSIEDNELDKIIADDARFVIADWRKITVERNVVCTIQLLPLAQMVCSAKAALLINPETLVRASSRAP